MKAEREPIRFKSILRGVMVDVELQILTLFPPTFVISFYGDPAFEDLERSEVAQLCREAQMHTELRDL